MRPASAQLTSDELRRYGRHLLLPEIGPAGQRKLKSARALLIGAGGLGSPAGLYLAAAGVGKIGIVDCDVVEISNLQRQILHSMEGVGKSKLASAAKRIQGLNPCVEVAGFETMMDAENASEIIREFDVVLDCTDNLPTRYLVNDACALLDKPDVYGSVFRFEGQASVFWAKRGPCLRCLHPEPARPAAAPSCAQAGVLGVLPGIIGTLQAAEAIKLILGVGKPLIGELVLFDALKMEWKKLKLGKNPSCAACGKGPVARGREEKMGNTVPEISVEELKAKLDRKENIVVLDVREPSEYEICHLQEAKLIPLDQLPERLGELEPSDEIAVHCRSGGRSARAVQFLRGKGFARAYNVAGGITAWAERIDPSMPTY